MSRSRYFKRRRVKAIFMKWMGELLFNTSVAVVLAATILLLWRVFNPPAAFSAHAESVAALRVPSQAVSNLYSLSQWYGVPFDQLLAMYSVANDFFPQGTSPVVDLDVLKANYVTGFRRLRRQYSSGDIRPYFELFQNLINELQHFPVPREYHYMFSDTWGRRRGTDILDRENIRGRIPVLSMSAGRILQASWDTRAGYHVIVVTASGSRILYAHLDSLHDGITQGKPVLTGQQLGNMGSSGDVLPVHLHIGISPNVAFAEDFWINPYPFLRHMEEKMYIFPHMVHNNYRRGTTLYARHSP